MEQIKPVYYQRTAFSRRSHYCSL